MGDKDYFIRQKAEDDLARIGFEAVDALTKAAGHEDMEIAARARRLLGTIKSHWAVPGDPAVVRQALSEYESLDDAARENQVLMLVALTGNQGFPAVCRVIRYDRSLLVAKQAALRLLAVFAKEPPKRELADELRRLLAGSLRQPARWVVAWLDAVGSPQALAADWTKIVAAEELLLLQHPRATSRTVVEGLLQLQIAALRKVDRAAEADLSVQRLIALFHGEPAAMARLLEWLIDQRDWAATRMLEERYPAVIAESPELLYLVAEAQALRGDAAAAEASAARALKLRPGASANALDWHLQAGRNLEARGRMPWAVREWEHVLRHARPESESAIDAARFLAELHHDLQQDRQAAETLDLLAKACTRRSDQWRVVGSGGTESITLGMLRSRMNYFWACHWKAQGDRVRQRASLDSALATHAYDIEVLIECYRVPDSPAEYRSHIRKLLDKRLCELREQIADCGNTVGAAQPCNEFAWLAANTEGDLDEALAFSKRSLALVGQHGAYYDTLARVHAARGEYAEALKHQTTAARLLPHTRAVQKQLEALRGKVEGEKREEGVKGVKGGNSLLRLRRPDSRAIGGTLQAPWNIREKSSQL